MAIIKKDRTPFRIDCASFAKRYPDHEAARLISEAERIIEELEEQAEEIAVRQSVGQPVRYEYRFYRTDGDWNQREGWSGWDDCRKEDYERISKFPEDGREVRALYAAPPAPAAVPVDGVGRRMIGDAIRSAYDAGYNDARNAQAKPGDSAPGYSGRTIESFHGEALSKSLSVIAGAAALLATHPQPAAAEQNANKGMADEYQEWIDFFHKGMGDYGDFLRNVVMPRVRQDDAPAAAGGDA
ncbi:MULTISPECIES: hypothetical protein [Xanthomonas]|uniref:Uncharacterized protein n=2 Tax=Xanthomonas TaxID=338 RepID=A0A7Z7NGB7_XANCH|nr:MULTISPECIES: hypothetical protein [Xanthomonas]ATS39296.1 hypothetical protein XcfCFBP6988P_15140 [Xanthomonas citri pv. phaseoli var. fuscans]ATS41897.1 hypothetical protein XcfCFBP6989P_05350 [Xanthomonas citri pv. phaseoli var. fuscans]ATS47299.1 hypothetical protein XcfCFBP6990P_12010 [Xanthomonas citri pv. phaseoli var. fuscans]ATS86322.1 hypothetical protein XcfCFBP6991P_22220 [Xanthomonas citri pv. phaseoli var. fuscans]QWN20940.1 hypothetical protein DGM98_13075 [Xanthomonas citri]